MFLKLPLYSHINTGLRVAPAACPPLAAACTPLSSPNMSPVVAAASFPVQLPVPAKHKIHYAVQLIFRMRLRSGKGRWGRGDNRLHKYPRVSETLVTRELQTPQLRAEPQTSVVLSLALAIGAIIIIIIIIITQKFISL